MDHLLLHGIPIYELWLRKMKICRDNKSLSKRVLPFRIRMLIALLFINHVSYSASNGVVKGTVKDAQTKDPLPFASVLLKETGIGAATDIDGVFALQEVPSGSYVLRIMFLGYQTSEMAIEVKEGEHSTFDLYLKGEGIEQDTIVVTAQAQGQRLAINEQLNSSTIKNVVSAAKIQELPDANAAESIARLPGVSLIRDGGEGARVVIRGLSSHYNRVTIDGVELSSNVLSGNNLVSDQADMQDATGSILGDRGTNLSMVSSNMLGGIEVIKAITPDMDAAVIGGVVNFGMRKASKSAGGTDENLLPRFEILSQGGYNALKDTRSDYKFVGSVEKRFFDNTVGVFAQGSAEMRNLSANELGVEYHLTEKDEGDAGVPDLTTLILTDVFRKRQRYGATVVMDLQHESGDVGFMNFISTSDTRSAYRMEAARVTSPNEQLYYAMTDAQTKLKTISNLLSMRQTVSLFQIHLKLSHSYSESQNPDDATFSFLQRQAGMSNALIKLPPKIIASYVGHSASSAFLWSIANSNTLSQERAYTGSTDFQTDYTLSDLVRAKLKFGGTYQYRIRLYDLNQRDGSIRYGDGGNIATAFKDAYPWLVDAEEGLGMENFIYDGYTYGNFLNGDYSLVYPLNVEFMRQLLPIANRPGITAPGGGGYHENEMATTLNDYSGNEVKSALYAMTTINIGEEFTLLPGVRYQNLTTTYTAVRAKQIPGEIQNREASATRSHGYVLPMVHFKYTPFDWLRAHIAYTTTVNYPDYGIITPRLFIGSSFISYNNTGIRPAVSENFDLVLSVYTNGIGLFSVNGFKKRIKDLIFYTHGYPTRAELSAYPDLYAYPDMQPNPNQLYEFTTYINSPFEVNVIGVETDWQTHLWYLPGPFSGIVFSINYTHIFSEASYPKVIKDPVYFEDGSYIDVVIDTLYTTRLLHQPNDILNASLGYDVGGFSARISMLYQDNIFKKPDFWMQNRIISDTYMRWDLSVKQSLPWFGIQLFFNLNNITGEDETDLNQKNNFPASQQRYGMTADAGLRITF